MESGVQNTVMQYSHFSLPFEKQIEKVRYNVALTTLCRLMAINVSWKKIFRNKQGVYRAVSNGYAIQRITESCSINGDIRELKQRRRQRQEKRHRKSKFALFQTSLHPAYSNYAL